MTPKEKALELIDKFTFEIVMFYFIFGNLIGMTNDQHGRSPCMIVFAHSDL